MIDDLKNLGAFSRSMLAAVGITSESALRELGAARAYVAIKRAGLKPSLNLLWALEGALSGRDWKAVAREDRFSLLSQVEMLEQANDQDVPDSLMP